MAFEPIAVRRDDGREYPSIWAAARELAEAEGAPWRVKTICAQISSQLMGRYGYRSVRGHVFEVMGDAD